MGLFTPARTGIAAELPIEAQIAQICGHLKWTLDDAAEPALFQEKRPFPAGPLDESLDKSLYDAVASIRALASGEVRILHGTSPVDCALMAVDAIAEGFPKRVFTDSDFIGSLERLRKLLKELRPRQCRQCGNEFVAGFPDETWCHACRTNRGKLGEIWRALISYWDSGQQFRISKQILWDQFCTAFKKRFGVLPKLANAGWTRNRKLLPSDDIPPIWEEFEAFCRDRLRSADVAEEKLRQAFHRTPIADAVRWMMADDCAPAPVATADQSETSVAEETADDGQVNVDQFLFVRDGTGYRISGFGETGHVVRIKGFDIIARLIQSPKFVVRMDELMGSGTNQNWTPQPVLDNEARRKIGEQLRDLNVDRDRAKNENNTVEVDIAQRQIDKLTSALESATSIGGGNRDLNSQANRLRPAIYANLKRAYAKLRAANPSMLKLADHFDLSICCEGGEFHYRPAQQVNWEFSLSGQK